MSRVITLSYAAFKGKFMLNIKKFYKNKKKIFTYLLLSYFILANCNILASATYQINPADITTTLTHTVMPVLLPPGSQEVYPFELSLFRPNDRHSVYGNWKYGNGSKVITRTDIAPGSLGIASGNSEKLMRFFTITDIHINDPETPAQAIYYGYCGNNIECKKNVGASPIASAFSPIMLYTTHVLDAVMQTINILHHSNAFDFGISLGDTCNNTQYNELRWYINVIDGGIEISPHSGARAGADRYMPFGLDKTIPWYQVLGNHDHLWIGSFPVVQKLKDAYVGENILKLGNMLVDCFDAIDKDTYYMGSINGVLDNGDMELTCVGPVDNPFNLINNKCINTIKADNNRRSLSVVGSSSVTNWMKEFFNTTSNPVGHGFTKNNLDTGLAYYSFEPKPGIKIIVLNNTMPSVKVDNVDVYGYGYLDKDQYNWLVSELNSGQSQNKLMIIAAHIPINVIPVDSSGEAWTSKSPISQAKLLTTLHQYPNLIMWIAGHRHVNAVTLQESPDPAHPEFGFWEVETASLVNFPQEFRTFDIYRNNDNTVSIVTVSVDPAVNVGGDINSLYPAAKSRYYAIASEQMFNTMKNVHPGIPYYDNVELIKQLSHTNDVSIGNNNWGLIGIISAAAVAIGGGVWLKHYKGSCLKS